MYSRLHAVYQVHDDVFLVNIIWKLNIMLPLLLHALQTWNKWILVFFALRQASRMCFVAQLLSPIRLAKVNSLNVLNSAVKYVWNCWTLSRNRCSRINDDFQCINFLSAIIFWQIWLQNYNANSLFGPLPSHTHDSMHIPPHACSIDIGNQPHCRRQEYLIFNASI